MCHLFIVFSRETRDLLEVSVPKARRCVFSRPRCLLLFCFDLFDPALNGIAISFCQSGTFRFGWTDWTSRTERSPGELLRKTLEMALAEKLLAESSTLCLSQGYAGLMGAPGPKGDPVSWFLRHFSLPVKDKRTVPPCQWEEGKVLEAQQSVVSTQKQRTAPTLLLASFPVISGQTEHQHDFRIFAWTSSDPCGTCRGEPAEVLGCLSPLDHSGFGFLA